MVLLSTRVSAHVLELPDVVVPDVGGGADDRHHGGLHPAAPHHPAPTLHWTQQVEWVDISTSSINVLYNFSGKIGTRDHSLVAKLHSQPLEIFADKQKGANRPSNIVKITAKFCWHLYSSPILVFFSMICWANTSVRNFSTSTLSESESLRYK